jgi:drug/metabolite transporter (DMT)-like permease
MQNCRRAIIFEVRPPLSFRPNIYLLVTVASWGLNFVAVKEIYDSKAMSPPSLALLRFLVMWASLVLVCLWRKESLRFPAGHTLKLLYLGFVSMGIYMLFFLEGMSGSAATVGAILLQMSPIFTAFLAVAFRQERFSWGVLAGGLVALAGTVLIVYIPSSGTPNNLLSNVIVFLSALLWGYSVILMRPLLMKYSPLRVLTLSMAGGLPVMAAYGFLPSLHEHWGAITPYGWLMFFHVAIVSGVVAFLCFYQGVRQVGSTGATLYQFMVPAAALLSSVLIQGYVPRPLQLIGFIVVLAGVAYAARARYLTQAASPVNLVGNEGKA